jgi:MSHA biogenesis protein MshJ
MKAIIKRYVERIDAASLRERVLIFLTLALVLVVAANFALLEPLRAKQKRLVAEAAQTQKELGVIQTELQRLVQASGVDPDAVNKGKQAALRDDLRRLNARISLEQRRFTPPERMRSVLEEMLEKNKGLALVDLKTLPVAPIAPPRPGAGSSSGMFRHGIELTVAGNYAALYEYLRTLEKLPTQLYWARAELAVSQHPLLTLKLTVHTVSFDRAWLIV